MSETPDHTGQEIAAVWEELPQPIRAAIWLLVYYEVGDRIERRTTHVSDPPHGNERRLVFTVSTEPRGG